MVNRKNLNLLADALESGKYEQGQKILRDSKNKFCCLGVACDISGMGVWTKRENDEYYTYLTREDGLDSTSAALLGNTSVRDWFGISVTGDFVTASGHYSDLAGMNDNGKTFAEIAEVLRDESIIWL